jgi:multidrug resistance efflux pump
MSAATVRRPWTFGVLLVLAAGGAAVYAGLPELGSSEGTVPTTRPQRGDLSIEVHATGDLRALQAMPITAPAVGGTLQLTSLLAPGTLVRKDELVVAFDLEEQRYNLEQARSELQEAEEEIVKLQADARVQAANDQVALLEARYAVRRAELQVKGNEFVGGIEAKKNLLALEEATRRLAQLADDVKTHAASNHAAAAVLEEKRRKAQLGMQFAERNIESMTIRAPIAGLVVVKENRDASGGFFTPGMVLPDYRPGDAVQPGRVVAEIVDIEQMEIQTKVDETDRPSLAAGAAATVSVDALARAELDASAKGISGLATRNFWDVSANRQFDAAFVLSRAVGTLRPGMTARVLVRGETLRNVQHLPRQVLFEKGGRPVVYVRNGSSFTPTEVKVLRLTESRVVIEGLADAVEVALTHPDAAGPGRSRPVAGPVVGGA